MSIMRSYRLSLLFCIGSLGMAPSVMAQGSTTNQLEEIVIVGQKQPYRGDTALNELPQSVAVLEGDLLQDIGITRLDRTLELASGIAKQNTFGGLWDSFAIRGFAGDENVPSGYLVNGFSGSRGFSGPRDASNIERVEIIKGPGGALFGRGEPGGTVNIVTKKPQFDREGYVEVSGGSWDTYRVAGDYTDAITDKIAFRVNGAYQDGNSYRDFLFMEKYNLTSSFLAVLNDSTKLSYELDLVDQRSPFDRGIVAVNEELEVIPDSRFLGSPNDGAIDIEGVGHQFVLQRKINEKWDILAGLSYRETYFEGFSSDPELGSFRQTFFIDNTNLARQRRFRDYSSDDLAGRIEFSGSVNTGKLVHHILIGADASDFELDQIQNRVRGAAAVPTPTLEDSYAVNVFNPVYFATSPTPGPFTNTLEQQVSWGIYAQDHVEITDRWKMTLGVRFDDFEQDIDNRRNDTTTRQSFTETSPRIGLVFEATPSISIYGSYSEGFRPNTGSDVNGVAFEPEETTSYEVGAKWASGDGHLDVTLAFYLMDKTAIIVADPLNPGFSRAGGEAESQGIEFDIVGKLFNDITVNFSYAYVDAEFTKDVADFNFGRAIPAGSRLINIPDHSVSLLLAKDFQTDYGVFNMSGNVQYVSDRVGETGVPSFELPDYTVAGLTVSYAPTEKFKFSLDINNLFDERYYPSSFSRLWVAPGADRNFTARVKYRL